MLVEGMIEEVELFLELVSFLKNEQESPYYEMDLEKLPRRLYEVVEYVWNQKNLR